MSSLAPPLHGESCEICNIPFEYKENPNWESVRLTLSEAFAAKLKWLAVPHEECDRIAKEREKEEKDRKARESKIKHTKRLLRDFGFPTLLENKTFLNFNRTKNNDTAFKELNKWCYGPIGLLLQGDPGRGKSHLMAAFVNKWAEMGIPVAFQNVSDLMEMLRRGFDDGSYQDRIRILTSTEVKILVLDDIGAEQPKDWVKEKLYQIIDARLRNQMPIFVTTNCTKRELSENLHPRVTSRLVEACKWITLKGEDYRDEISRLRTMRESEDQLEEERKATEKKQRDRIAEDELAKKDLETIEFHKREAVRLELEAKLQREKTLSASRASEQELKSTRQLPMPFSESDKEALRNSLVDPFWLTD
jgi:DNA replication protein DnaC